TVSALLIMLSILPFLQQPHWTFRVPEFMKTQLIFLQLIAAFLRSVYITKQPCLWYLQAIHIIFIAYQIYILIRYTALWKTNHPQKTDGASELVKIISCNIYQYNNQYDRFIALIRQEKPDIFLTMESDHKWEQALRVLEKDYPIQEKVTLD